MTGRLQGVSLGFAAVSLAVVIAVGLYCLPLSVDGGWYSYPSFAASEERDPFSYQLPVSEARSLSGLKVLFRFETTSSVRFLYATTWFRLLGANDTSIRLLSLVELSSVLLLAFLLYASFFGDRLLAVVCVGLLATDKTVILSGVSDFRPDLALAALACGLYLLLRTSGRSTARTVAACFVAAALSLTSPVSAAPLAFVIVAVATDALRSDGATRRSRIAGLVAVGLAAALAFLGRAILFRFLLGTDVQVHDPVHPLERTVQLLAAGPAGVLAKEVARFTDYFWVSNVPLLAALVLTGACLLVRGTDGRRVPTRLHAPLAGLGASVIVLVFLDPHQTGAHLIPVMPFVLLLGAKLQDLRSRVPQTLLASLVIIGSLGTVALGAKDAARAAQDGVDNAWRRRTLTALLSERRQYTIVGPTELWPYYPTNRDVLIVDLTRNADALPMPGLSLREVDYVVLNKDYDVDAWVRRLGSLTGRPPRLIVDKRPELTILDVRVGTDDGGGELTH